MQCHGYKCEKTALINAHIIPRGFARDMKGDSKHNLLISTSWGVRPSQHGIYDNDILCACCDGKLGKLDDFALDVSRRFPSEHRIVKREGRDWFELENVNTERFATFLLSVIWRTSICTRPEFARLSLGSYEDLACEVIFGAKGLSQIPSYQLIVARYQQAGTSFNPADNYSFPAPFKEGSLNVWRFSLNGFLIIAKIDKRPLPANLEWASLKSSNMLTGPMQDFFATAEGKAVKQIRATHPYPAKRE